MEFWGIEVKPGASVKCDPGYQKYLHLSSASFGDVKKEKSSDAVLSVKINNQKLVIGILSTDSTPQVSFDLVFEKEFELSHNGKTSVHFCGYKAAMDQDRPDFSDLEELSEDELDPPANGKSEVKKLQAKPAQAKAAKPDPSAEKPKAQQKDEKPDEDDDDSDEDDFDEEGSDEVMMDSDDGSDSEEGDEDDDEDDSSDEEETPKKAEPTNKRPAESGFKTPAEKKAKIVTPVGQKSGGYGKKVAHIATPHPNKQAGKTPATNDKSKQRTSKSGGQFSCKSCNKSFNSDNALQSHSKAKHSK